LRQSGRQKQGKRRLTRAWTSRCNDIRSPAGTAVRV
jgi:hypothetical protein